jgi:uncharacterized protein
VSELPKAGLLYLDASAFVKLVLPEPETAALVAALDPKARLVASEILEIEALRAVRRASPGEEEVAAARMQLEGVRLLPITDEIRRRACELEPGTLRTLDAIHIATALDLGQRLQSVYAYDARLIDAARHAGLRVCAPMPQQPADQDAGEHDAQADPSVDPS